MKIKADLFNRALSFKYLSFLSNWKQIAASRWLNRFDGFQQGVHKLRFVTIFGLVIATLLTSCESNVKGGLATISEGQDASAFLVVDCLLPGQVRKLGSNLTYLTQRRPVKTTTGDCEIRGGEYVAYDRADYSTALKIWLPMAEVGDAEAQNYVGEIFEKGLGLISDYKVAAHWYQQAAKQGLSRAQINLGNLYEKGLGVQKDLQLALNFYRQASGINNDDLMFASTLNAGYVPRESYEVLETELVQQQRQRSKLEQNLIDVSSTLNQRSEALSKTEKDLVSTQQSLTELTLLSATFPVTLNGSEESSDSILVADIKQFKSEREQLEQQLKQSNMRNKQLENSQYTLAQRLANNEKHRLSYQQIISSVNKELETSKQRFSQSKNDLLVLEQSLIEKQGESDNVTPVIIALQDDLAVKTRALIDEQERVAALETSKKSQLKSSEAALKDLSEQHTLLSNENKQYQEQLAALKTTLADREHQLTQTNSRLALAQDTVNSVKVGQQQLSEKETVLVGEINQLESARQNLEKKLAKINQQNNQLDKNKQSLQTRLAQAEAAKTDYQQKLKEIQQHLLVAKKSIQTSEKAHADVELKLQHAQASSSELTPVILALQDDLATKTRALIDARQRYQGLEVGTSQDKQQLNDALLDLESDQQTLSTENNELKQQLSTLNKSLAELGFNRKNTEQQLLLSKAELSLERNQQAQHLTKLSDQHAVDLQKQQEKLGQVTERFQHQLALVSSQRRQIENLQDEAIRFQNELTFSSPPAALPPVSELLAVNDFPGIEIIEPPVVLTRSLPSVRLRSFKGERQIIGKVNAPAGLMSLSVNGKTQNLGLNNLFRSSVPLQGDPTPVEVVVVDNKGRRAAVSFSFITYGKGEGQAKNITATFKQGMASDGVKEVVTGQYYALIIGNNNYEHYSTLSTAVNDAKMTEQLLSRRYNFNTRLLLNADRYSILSALNEMRINLKEEDNLLIYYAGHGRLDESNNRGYWLPIDAELDNSSNWISNTAITDILNVTKAKHVLVVADSCYAGTLTQSPLARVEMDIPTELREEWVEVMLEARARITLTSGGLEPVLDGGGGSHSIFAKAFLGILRENKGLLEGYSLYSKVLSRIAQNPNEITQVPQYAPIHLAGHEAGEFFFNPT